VKVEAEYNEPDDRINLFSEEDIDEDFCSFLKISVEDTGIGIK
jgi:signal transduction histidine kinase